MKALVLQHIPCETAGLYEEVLRERGVSIHRVEVDEGRQLPDWRGFEAIVAMGGPMSVNDDTRLPWLSAEKRLIRDAVLAGRPYWGVCLGAQLLAASLGARVYAGPSPEIGVMPVQLTAAARADAVFAGVPPDLLTFQWHGETFDLPAGATLLASSPAYSMQAFRWQDKAYGIQFHLEVSARAVESWSKEQGYKEGLERALGEGAASRLASAVDEHQKALHTYGRVIFENWLKTCGLAG
jgi:GMP synthase-like glutamine amidotransferase